MTRLVFAALLLTTGSSGWRGSNSTAPEPDGPWRQWARTKSPLTVRYLDDAMETLDGVRTTATSWMPTN